MDTIENFDALNALLHLVTPGLSADLRFALTAQYDPPRWDALIDEAHKQGVASYLHTILLSPNFATKLETHHSYQLRQSYLSTVAQNMLALHDAEIILTAFQESGISAAGLKGIFLLESVYDDIGARAMSDIDLLIKKKDLAVCFHILESLGYQPTTYFSLNDANTDTKHLPPMEKAGGALVELHWTLLEEDEPFTIDADALWERAVPATISGVDALALGIEDLILHLCLHLTYQHFLNLGLRGLFDIALVIHNFRAEIDWQKLVRIAQSWGAERVTALTLKLVETELGIPIPVDIFTALVPEGIEPGLLENARLQLLARVWFEDQFTPDMVELSAKKGLLAKVKIGLQRVFIPRMALARIYNVSPTSPKILWCYVERLNYLARSYGKTVLRLQRGEKGTEPARQKAEISKSLHEWMKPHKK